uniref:DNA-directed RNA polymerase n=1 Tax=Dunaliella salina TaxID=3046 RepID=D0FY17_DUNSA|nr:beta subunit of RNA polymerase fragment 1 [Dunaliella salina]ACS95103.1 beta subunit of RNA polymerase fragment 1 [Dunaliella salina]
MPINRYFLSDFVTVQRQSFFELLEKGLIEEFAKRNPITNGRKDYSFFFYPEYYILTRPEYKPHEAILKNKSYTSKLFVPVQITNKKHKQIVLKWVYIGNIPLMTKRGHFILNGAARVIVNQILRSPGIYYQQKIYENYEDNKGSKSNAQDDETGEGSSLQPVNTYKRFYCDLICMRGSWLRIEMDKEKNIWAQMKKGPKIPIYWFLLAMGLSEKVILKSIMDPQKVLGNLERNKAVPKLSKKNKKDLTTARSAMQADETLKSTGEDKKNLEIKQDLIVADSLNESNSQTDKTTKLFWPEETREGTKGALTGFPHDLKNEGEENSLNKINEVNFVSEFSNKSVKNDFIEEDNEKAIKTNASTSSKKQNYPYLKNTPEAWQAIYTLLHSKTKISNVSKTKDKSDQKDTKGVSDIARSAIRADETLKSARTDKNQDSIIKETFGDTKFPGRLGLGPSSKGKNLTELGRQWLYNRFMNPRSYDLGKQGRIAFNKKLGLTIASHQLTLTGLDVLYATDYLIKVEKGIFNTDDIDHLKNRRVRTSGELIQIQIGVGLVRLEKFIRYNENMLEGKRKELIQKTTPPPQLTREGTEDNLKSDSKVSSTTFYQDKTSDSGFSSKNLNSQNLIKRRFTIARSAIQTNETRESTRKQPSRANFSSKKDISQQLKGLTSSSIINNKAFNSAIREFFGTSPLSQFMDQINPLAELTHKRRLSSMGPGGVTRDTATLAIRGIHPTHYGRICPIETPEGKNTGLVNSMTTYARVNSSGILESPFYKVYKGQVQKNTGMYYLNAEQEEKIKLAAADLYVSPIGFLPKAMIPARIAETFTKISRSSVQYIGVSPLQMISIAASLIPFLEHDDANRALMGSNMQRQAVPLIRHERPIVGTGLEGRAVSDSGHVIQSRYSGLVTYVSAKKIIVSI